MSEEDFGCMLKNLTKEDSDHLLILDIRLYVFVFVLLPMAIIGLLLNSFTILVLLHPRMRNSTNIYLTALSIANIVCLFNFIFLYSFRYLFSYTFFQNTIRCGTDDMNMYESFINLSLRFIAPIFSTFQLYAIYLTCAVTIDRWIYLKWPLKADTICTTKVTIKVICGVFAFCVLYNLPRWFEVQSQVKVSSQNRTYYQANGTEFGSNRLYMTIYQRYGYLIFVYGLPFCVLLIVNIGIIQKLIENEKRKHTLLGKKSIISKSGNKSNGSKKYNKPNKRNSVYTPKIDPRTTFMVLAVVVAFFFCQFPYLVLHLLYSYGYRIRYQYNIAKAFCDFLAALNCCVNFLIFCFFGQNFRRIAKLMIFHPSFDPYNPARMQRDKNRKADKIVSKNNEIRRKNLNTQDTTERSASKVNDNQIDESVTLITELKKETVM